MTDKIPDEARAALPLPYRDATFRHRRHGIYDEAEVDVFVDEENEFAVLHPRPVLDYSHYVPRQQKLGLGSYKKTLDVLDRRLEKIDDLFPQAGTVLEVGAAEGGFLAKLRAVRPGLSLMAVEPDRETDRAREALALARNFSSIAEAHAAGIKADIVCLFHVFEHISDPQSFLDEIRQVLAPGGRIIIEVPSFDDPLLSLYALPAYEAFYFQRQHPFVYSARSLSKVIASTGLVVAEIRSYQRYGLENHLTWLRHGRPGGDAILASALGSADHAYKAALEAKGATDTVFAIAREP